MYGTVSSSPGLTGSMTRSCMWRPSDTWTALGVHEWLSSEPSGYRPTPVRTPAAHEQSSSRAELVQVSGSRALTYGRSVVDVVPYQMAVDRCDRHEVRQLLDAGQPGLGCGAAHELTARQPLSTSIAATDSSQADALHYAPGLRILNLRLLSRLTEVGLQLEKVLPGASWLRVRLGPQAAQQASSAACSSVEHESTVRHLRQTALASILWCASGRCSPRSCHCTNAAHSSLCIPAFQSARWAAVSEYLHSCSSETKPEPRQQQAVDLTSTAGMHRSAAEGCAGCLLSLRSMHTPRPGLHPARWLQRAPASAAASLG